MRFDFRNSFPEKVSIIGAARSGLAAAAFFSQKGTKVFISDTCEENKLQSILTDQLHDKVEYEAGGHTERILDSQLIVLSPGVRSDLPILLKAKEMGIPVWSEMELGFQASAATFLAVTGSTGKSTTVSLLGAALKASGLPSVVAGNIGIPVISEVPQLPENAVVAAEVSSFQLENIEGFRPLGAAVLNLMKNHLDRYSSEEDYYNAKKEIARNFTRENYLVLNANDPLLREWAASMQERTNVVYFGGDVPGCDCFYYENGTIRFRFRGENGIIPDIDKMHIKGKHNYENACAAAALAVAAGVDKDAISEGFCGFEGLPHRLEYVAELDGVKFYNDSKSTTAESVAVAVSAFPGGVHLIAGGRDKGCDFTVVNEYIRKHVSDICLIGEAADRMQGIWDGLAPINRAGTLHEAILKSLRCAASGDVVVFSPGCSSFDMFISYEERGNVFKQLVRELVSERAIS
jgi:UDP-N-acetylmuramoylalanine--D-glutamate ligase